MGQVKEGVRRLVDVIEQFDFNRSAMASTSTRARIG